MQTKTAILALLLCGLPGLIAPNASGQEADPQRQAGRALGGLDVADGLDLTLFAAEPMLTNPTNMDIDARGRVWVIEGYNYRPDLNPSNPVRDAGDRILILEDVDGDGKADTQKVFYQNTDINAALGLSVLGNRVIVSAYENVFVFTDEDGDDRPDKKELLFTGLEGRESDHAVHAFVFGPDGKLYFNFGNAGGQIHDRLGNLIIDDEGNPVVADGSPYWEGMVFRTDLDGNDFEVLAHNFRNNYEVAVDSYGTLWQSDNDDDGNRAVRINYVMEDGNYGRVDEMTGAGWTVRRTNMEEAIPEQHWHLNDPGVVPNLLLTGAGSPTGILVYEGRLLPRVFWDEVIHADAGPNVVRAYPAANAGAGYEAEVVNLVEGARDQWFRPSDVTVAPDGSLFIADWYDPGVGGHQAGDQERGRIFRVAPPGTRYQVPDADLSTPAGAARALQSPNLATRYLAWTKLHGWGREAEPALEQLWRSDNPRFRARALWLLTKIPGRGAYWVDQALRDDNPDIRITGLRAARQLEGVDILPYVRRVVRDASPQVRREAALALRHHGAPAAADLWAELALQHDGRDRWYLEALGIGADRQWDRFFAAWRSKAGEAWNSPAGRDIVWRARAAAALPLLGTLIADPATGERERLRYFRAFDFHRDPSKQDVLLSLLEGSHPAQAQIATLALQHLDPARMETSPALQAALRRALAETKGTQAFVDLVARYGLRDQNEALLQFALDRPDSSIGVAAADLLIESGGFGLLKEAATGSDPEAADAALRLLGRVQGEGVDELLREIILDPEEDLALRRAAVQAYGQGWDGEDRLLALVQEGMLPPDLEPAAGSLLLHAYREGIRTEAARHLGQPSVAGGTPLPPIRQLVAHEGVPQRGEAAFMQTCSTCHVVNGRGTDFGPNLSEIGSKLSKEALYTSILHPDAGISFGYEGFLIRLKDGSQAVGYIASETSDDVVLRMPGGISRTYRKPEIASRTPLEQSLMPSNLHQALSQQELVDLVEYLSTLKRAIP